MYPLGILTLLGLVFEFVSVLVTVRKLFFGYHRRIDEMGMKFQERIRKDRIEGTIVLIFLVVGITFQAFGVLLSTDISFSCF